ncbi:hypothetical protein EIM50_08795 [Pseudoxanthomonas sp. SGD-10]|nr:hypothetical protein EIM50_08795 [Pseudoxanthomonas sp. SGD-10]
MENRSAIDAELQRLEKLIPELKAQGDEAAALDRFAEASAPLTRNAQPEHEAYITRRLQCMLVQAGLVAGAPEGEPCEGGEDAAPPEAPRG